MTATISALRHWDEDLLVALFGKENGTGKYETSDEILDRVAHSLASVETLYAKSAKAPDLLKDEFFGMMAENRFWPSGRILQNAGTMVPQLGSCFVIPVTDDLAGVFEALGMAALCQKSGGGTGFDFSMLRPRGAPIGPEGRGVASGPLPWIQLFNQSTSAIMQGGLMRGANLGALSAYHPQLGEFVGFKTRSKLDNFNLSVSVDDAFMAAVTAGTCIEHEGRTIDAPGLWAHIVDSAWACGDPGLLFLDAINRGNTLLKEKGEITATNPCGEQTLFPWEPSNLGSINLAAHIDASQGRVDWTQLEKTIRLAVRFLDNAIEASHYPDPRFAETIQETRRLGLGVMGFADALLRLNIGYDSSEGFDMAEAIGAFIKDIAWQESDALSEERGPCPLLSAADRPRRNCAITSIAPTGSIAMVAKCSYSIEPRFAPHYYKKVFSPVGVKKLYEDFVSDLARDLKLERDDAIAVIESGAWRALSVGTPMRTKHRFAHDVSATDHVRMLAVWQKNVDNGISKTVNLPADATPGDVGDAMLLAWELGCKGVSVYRATSREVDLMTETSAPLEHQMIQSVLQQSARTTGR